MNFPEIASIKRKRQGLGLKQKELAKMSGVSQSLIAKMESGKVMPSYEIAKKLFLALEANEHAGEKTCKEIMTDKLITVNSKDSLLKASEIMKRNNISQLPIKDKKEIIGSVSENIIYEALAKNGKQVLGRSIEEFMGEPFPIVSSLTPISVIMPLLKTSPAILVREKSEIVGIITKSDFL